jgi:hypothetical protein
MSGFIGAARVNGSGGALVKRGDFSDRWVAPIAGSVHRNYVKLLGFSMTDSPWRNRPFDAVSIHN